LNGEAFLKDVNPGYMPIPLDVQPAGVAGTYGIPYASNDDGALYNKEIFAAYNVAVPETWDEVDAATNTFKQNGVNPFLQFAFSALNGMAQSDLSIRDVTLVAAAGQAHSYPSDFDVTPVLSQFALNKKNGMNEEQNIRETLQAADTLFQALR
jgi:hypothetical protein